MKALPILLAICHLFLTCKNEPEKMDGYERINNLKNLDALKKECLLYKKQLVGNIEEVIKLGRDTQVADQYFRIRLYPGIPVDRLTEISKDQKLNIPEEYKMFLHQINGAFIKDISLYGLPVTGLKSGEINRKELEPLNLYTANSIWKYEHTLDTTSFLIGSSPFDSTGNKFYLMKYDSIYSSRENGTIINKWASLNEMLEFELKRFKSRHSF